MRHPRPDSDHKPARKHSRCCRELYSDTQRSSPRDRSSIGTDQRESAMTSDKLIHATAADNRLRCMAAVTTNLVGEACRRHRTSPTASAALGRTLAGGLLLGSGVKEIGRASCRERVEMSGVGGCRETWWW